jgi:hypothetical protein
MMIFEWLSTKLSVVAGADKNKKVVESVDEGSVDDTGTSTRYSADVPVRRPLKWLLAIETDLSHAGTHVKISIELSAHRQSMIQVAQVRVVSDLRFGERVGKRAQHQQCFVELVGQAVVWTCVSSNSDGTARNA